MRGGRKGGGGVSTARDSRSRSLQRMVRRIVLWVLHPIWILIQVAAEVSLEVERARQRRSESQAKDKAQIADGERPRMR